jgi:hypothetical protein
LAEFHWQSAYYGFQYPKEALAGAKQATIRALEFNDSLPEAHALLGSLRGIADCDWQAAGLFFRRALESNANSPYVLFRYANFNLWPSAFLSDRTNSLINACDFSWMPRELTLRLEDSNKIFQQSHHYCRS